MYKYNDFPHNPLLLRPITPPHILKAILGNIYKSKQLFAYKQQRHIEHQILNQKPFTFSATFVQLPREYQQHLTYYHAILTNSFKLADCNPIATPYSTFLVQQQPLLDWVNSQQHHASWQESQFYFRRSLTNLTKQQYTITHAKKAYRKAPWFSLYFWHYQSLKNIRQCDHILHVLADTHLLSRQTKRVNYYTYLAKDFKTIDHSILTSQSLYPTEALNIVKQALLDLKDRCKQTLQEDLKIFNVNTNDQTFLNHFLQTLS